MLHFIKTFRFVPALILLSAFCYGQGRVTIVGTVADQDGRHLPGAYVRVIIAPVDDRSTTTDGTGSFVFTGITRSRFYIISSGKPGYLNKRSICYQDEQTAKDTVFVSVRLRQRQLAVINTSSINRKTLGLTIEEAMTRFKIDTTECSLRSEPPGISRGIRAELADSTILYLQIPRTVNFEHSFSNILKKRVTGIGLAFTNCTKRQFGRDFFWHGVSNPYCEEQ